MNNWVLWWLIILTGLYWNNYCHIQVLENHTDTLAKMVQQQQYQIDVIAQYIKESHVPNN